MTLRASAAPVAGQPWTAETAGIEFVWIASASLWAAKFETTNQQFRVFRPAHESGEVLGRSLDRPRQPAVQVSYEDALAFADWHTKVERAQGAISEEQFYRLPLPEEWLAMAGCDDGRSYPWGEEWPPDGANCADASIPIHHPLNVVEYNDGHPVASDVDDSEGNELDLHGMGGNVAEWVCEWYDNKRRRRTIRGGSWRMNKPEYMDCAFRNGFKPDFRTDSIGFRLVLAGPAPLDIDPRMLAAALGGLLVIIGGIFAARCVKIHRRQPTVPEPSPATATPPPSEQAAFSMARHTPKHRSKTTEPTSVPAPPPERTPAASSEIRLATSMDETQERDKSIVASILEIRSQAQAHRDAAKGGGKAPDLPKKRK